jgi:tight adherence protein C
LCAGTAAVSIGAILTGFQLAPHTWPAVAAAAGFMAPTVWLRDRIQARRRETLKTLPFFLDVITLCVEAGLNLTGALAQAVAKGPAGALRDELARVLRDVRAGKARLDALHSLADRMNEPAISGLVSALVQADGMGMSLGPVLRAQAEQRRAERFARAEKLAMEAPVKLLLPLIAFIFPCTFAVLAFPIAMKFIQMGF